MMYQKVFVRMCEIIQTLGAGGLVAVPSFAELDGPEAGDVTTYFQAANADAEDLEVREKINPRRFG